ncbi:MAG: cation-translocating P-type ATPase [Spirochaetaceae bacterium]|nr:MAG: cation-translocating P-type ATPase [Spirochaetaceae bacterium]
MQQTSGTQLTREYRIEGMDCADCARHVTAAISSVPGVAACDVFLGSERAVVHLHTEIANDTSNDVDATIRASVAQAGYRVGDDEASAGLAEARHASRTALRLLAGVSVVVLLIVVLGEWFGLLDGVTDRVPWYVSLLVLLAVGFRPLLVVLRNALRGRVVSHSLMTVGAVAAALAGQWSTAAIVVVFMRVGAYAEAATAGRSRSALRELTAMAPRTARRIDEDGAESQVAVAEVAVGDRVVVRPGEAVPTDGEVIDGEAYLDQSAITGESQPVAAAAGVRVFAASLVSGGALVVRVTAAGEDTTFARVIRLVQDAERNRAVVERAADRFSGYYLPIVAVIAGATWFFTRDISATIAVMVVACSCSFALATPIAMLASIGAAAREGVLIKGGATIESLARVSVVLLDKTGTVTTGKPRLVASLPLIDNEASLLRLAASVEQRSEHPIAEALRREAVERGIVPATVERFRAVPGIGVEAVVDGSLVSVRRADAAGKLPTGATDTANPAEWAREQEAAGRTVLCVHQSPVDQPDQRRLAGLLATSDRVRPAVAEAVARLRELGIDHIELITGDNRGSAEQVAAELGIACRAGLLPQDKIAVVREHQARGARVAMIGDGVNDAPALAGADVGIAMGAAGSDVAVESAHVALMGDDWLTVPLLFQIARRTMRVVRLNIGFTAVYNLLGLSLAALGLLPPVIAAAAQSLPDLGILANSSRLLRLPAALQSGRARAAVEAAPNEP